jgi:hypothetical protein
MNQIKKEVRQAIIEAVPEISELKFGCRVAMECVSCGKMQTYLVIRHTDDVRYSDGLFRQYRLHATDDNCLSNTSWTDLKDCPENWETVEVLGRPLTLPDVLRTIGADRFHELTEVPNANWSERILERLMSLWNLSKPLDEQSEEVWRFLHSVLIFKK